MYVTAALAPQWGAPYRSIPSHNVPYLDQVRYVQASFSSNKEGRKKKDNGATNL
ncbi:hypothetical protein ACSS6W_001931 [Trichoderma asperelloides]